jgi:hypothetical protein
LASPFIKEGTKVAHDAGLKVIACLVCVWACPWLGTKMPLGVEKSVRYDADYLKSLFKAPGSEAGWVLNDQEYFERPGLSVLVFHDSLRQFQS